MLQSGGQDQKWPTSGLKVLKPSSFFFVLTLVSSAIKADSVLRQQWPRGMYSKVSLATGLDAGEAVLHRGRAQWGRRTCMYCTLHAGGGACHDQRGSTPRKTAKLRLHQNQRATNHQELTIMTYRGPLVQNRKTHTPGWKVKQAESLRRVHTAQSLVLFFLEVLKPSKKFFY